MSGPKKKEHDADTSVTADRIRLYRQRQESVTVLKEEQTDAALWNAVVAFQDYPFKTVSGLEFRYKLNTGRSGEYTKELLIDRRENSKSLSWSSVVLAFNRAMERKGQIIARPKELGDIRGISYIYPMLWRFGLISVPEDAAAKMEIQQNMAAAVRINDAAAVRQEFGLIPEGDAQFDQGTGGNGYTK